MSSTLQRNSSKTTFKKLMARPAKREPASKEKFDNKVGAPLQPMRFSLDSDCGKKKEVKDKKEGKGSRSLLKVLKKALPCTSRKAMKKNFEGDMDPVVNLAPPVGSRPEQIAIHRPPVRHVTMGEHQQPPFAVKPVDRVPKVVAALVDEDEEEERRIAELERRTEAALNRLNAYQDVYRPSAPQVVTSVVDDEEEEKRIAELERRTQAALSRLDAHPIVHRPVVPIPQIIVTPSDNDITEEQLVVNKVDTSGPQQLTEEALKRDKARNIAQKLEDILESTTVQPTIIEARPFPVAEVELGFNPHEFAAHKQIVLNRARLRQAAKNFEKNPIFQTTNTTVITTAPEEHGHVSQSTTIATATITASTDVSLSAPTNPQVARDIKYTYTAPPSGVFYALSSANSQAVRGPPFAKIPRKVQVRRKVKRAVFKVDTEEAGERLAVHGIDKPKVPSKTYNKNYNKNYVDAREYLPVYEKNKDGEPRRRNPRDFFARGYMGYIPMDEFKEVPEVVEPLEVRVKVAHLSLESETSDSDKPLVVVTPRPSPSVLVLEPPRRRGNINHRYTVHEKEELVGRVQHDLDELLVQQSVRRSKPIPF